MNDDLNTGPSGTSDPSTDREQILATLHRRIEFVDRRVETLLDAGDTDEAVLIRWIRTEGYLSGQYRKLMKDTDIDRIQDDLELLKNVADLEETQS